MAVLGVLIDLLKPGVHGFPGVVPGHARMARFGERAAKIRFIGDAPEGCCERRSVSRGEMESVFSVGDEFLKSPDFGNDDGKPGCPCFQNHDAEGFVA